MLYTRDYDFAYIPSMPVAEITIGRNQQAPMIQLMALVDSGADATIIPLRYLREIRARRRHPGWLRGTAIHRVQIDLYVVALKLGTFNAGLLRVVGSEEYEEAILGRDVLNQLVVTLNGLASAIEISD